MALDPDIQAKYAHNGKVIVGSAILLLILILIIILFQTYSRLCLSRRLFPHPLSTNSSTSTPFNECLHPSILKSLPTFTYSSATHRPLHDCAVCLSEFADGDKGRILPNCNHAFHSHCIDTWFGSHSNCPLCRTPVQPATPSSNVEPCSVSVSEAGEIEEHVGCSSLPAPIGCPRKPLALGIIIEVPEEETGSDPVPGDHGLKWPDHGILSLQRVGDGVFSGAFVWNIMDNGS